MDVSKLTPAQKQYWELKQQYNDCILFFRMGDFYETFYEDAKICSKVCEIALTQRHKDSANPIPMAGVPYHSAEKYLQRMVKAGYKVAIGEQIGEVVAGQIVKRQVTSIITPGTYIDEKDTRKYNFIGAIWFGGNSKDQYHMAWGDFSVGEYFTKSFQSLEDLMKFIIKIDLSELIIDIDFPGKDDVQTYLGNFGNIYISIYDIPFDSEATLKNVLGVQSLGSFGESVEAGRKFVLALLFNYLKNTQKSSLKNISRISYHGDKNKVIFDDISVKNLEILRSSYEGSRKHSLLGVIDHTQTPMGGRLLSDIIVNPIQDLNVINWRLDGICSYVEDMEKTKLVINLLKGINDIPRTITTLLYKKNNPFIMNRLKSSLRVIFDNIYNEDDLGSAGPISTSSSIIDNECKLIDMKSHIDDGNVTDVIHSDIYSSLCGEKLNIYGKEDNTGLKGSIKHINTNKSPLLYDELIRFGLNENDIVMIKQFYDNLESALKDEGFIEDLDYIKDGYDKEIDDLRKIAYHSDDLLLQYQQEIIQNTGIQIKVRYINNQGYFLETTKKDSIEFEKKAVRDDDKMDFIRRQTLKSAERYVSPYLEKIQIDILTSKSKLQKLESKILERFRDQIENLHTQFFKLAETLSRIDIFSTIAKLGKEKNWIRPELKHSYDMEIIGGRHPVIEEFLPIEEQFVPNDLIIGNQTNLQIITGPNMGGKSTFLRQNALIVLLVHCGLLVPAKSVKIGLIDGLYARVGSGDIIAKNQSTFMTEMIEVSNIMHNATRNSFIVLDELGRGTSTYDGVALAKAIVEYISIKIEAKTLFATHYHELISLENDLIGVKNYSVSVYETDKQVVFLKKIVKGGVSKSYGIDVAQLAGLPPEILQKSREYLKGLEQNSISKSNSVNNISNNKQIKSDMGNIISTPLFQMSIPVIDDNKIKKYDELKKYLDEVDINNITPIQALEILNRLKNIK